MEKRSHKTASKTSNCSGLLPVTGITVAPLTAASQYHHLSQSQHHASSASMAGIGSRHRSTNSSHHHGHSHGHHGSSYQHIVHHSVVPKSTNNNSAAILNAKAAACTAAMTGISNAADQLNALTVVHPKTTTTTVRNKNEEAINDLRQRIPEIENIFDVHSRIGNGTFSTVLLGTLKKERELPENMRRKFAIKHHIPTSHPDRIMKELQCMAKIGGTDNVVGINCCIRYNESVAFIMPYMAHDRFHDFFNKMELSELQHYMRNLLIALRHVHKFNVIHRDVKPSNFLYNRRKRQFLLVDFGLAQQVPTAHMTGALESGCEVGNNGSLSLNMGAEGKRPRDLDEAASSKPTDACSGATGDMRANAKRIRCAGPQGDQQGGSGGGGGGGAANASTPNARVANSCIMGGSPFKMPLKQLNETVGKNATIALPPPPPASGSNHAIVANNNNISSTTTITPNNNNDNNINASINTTTNNNGIYEGPLGRQVKSAILGSGIAGRLQQKLRSQQTQNASGRMGGGVATTGTQNAASATGPNNNAVVPAETTENPSNKYNTNRNLTHTNGSKCICYGNPQVCNICLIKKEIHASRAGTPGYRPPEVLLKYPDQTTAVDIWAAGVIFLSILSSVYPFFKAPNDFVALAEMVTIFGDKTIRKTAFLLDRLVTLSQKTKPLDLRKLCVRFRNRIKFSSPELLKKYQRSDGSCEVCRNCDQFYFNCLCSETNYNTEPLDDDDPFPPSAYDLLYKLLEVNPHQRITAEEALNHPFFSEVHPSKSMQALNNNNNNSIAANPKESNLTNRVDGTLLKKACD